MPPTAASDDGGDATAPRFTIWHRLGRPLQILVWLAIVAAVVVIYNGASSLVNHIFSVLLLFIFAAVVALLLNPVVDFMQRAPVLRTHRAVAVLALYLGAFALIGGAMAVVIPNLIDQARHIPQLVDQLQRSLADRGIHIDLKSLVPSTAGLVGNAITIVTSVATVIVDVVLIVVISVYLLVGGRALVATLRNVFP